MATVLHFTNLLNFVYFLSILLDLCSGSAIWNFNGTFQEILPNENNIHEVNLFQKLVYHQKVYSKLYITKDGRVGFKDGLNYKAVDFSGPNVSPFVDHPFIAPYYYEGQSLDTLQGYTGHVYYHQMNLSSSGNQAPVYPSVVDLGKYLRSQVVGSEHFYANWALQVTWVNVTSFDEISKGSCSGTVLSPCPMNTFQLVLLSDGIDSYAIFNYGDMNVPKGRFDQAGFNGGGGTGWFGVLQNGFNSGMDLSQNQGSDVRGRYIFKISSVNIVRGGCSTSPDNKQLSVYPTFAGMFGGRMIDISGPCFADSINNIRCRFGNTPSTPVTVNTTRLRCVVPHLTVRGIVKLSVSVDGGRSYPYETPFTIVHPGRMPSGEHLAWEEAWYDYRSNQIRIKWKPMLLSNHGNMMSEQVDISLIGYREFNGQAIYQKLLYIASVSVSSGEFSFQSDDKQCSGQDCFDFELGLFEVRLQNQRLANQYGFLVSKGIPLGWYVRQAMESRHGSNWQSAMCTNWYDKDKQDTNWLQGLLNCPCSLDQALADFGRWQPDSGCTISNKNSQWNCHYHQGAAHCVRSVQPVLAAGNQCCFSEKTGSLMFAADTFQGSTPDRSHDWGAAPYGKPDYVPYMSHGIHDVVSFYYCCLWTSLGPDCHHYMDLRPTQDCNGYTPPRAASVYGQGHVTTFTGFKYRMYGPGDYVLATLNNTVIQGQFKRNPVPTENNYTITSTVALTSVAIIDRGTSDRVEISLRVPPANRDNQRLDVRINGVAVMFDNGALAWQDFKGVAVVNTDKTELIQSNFTVILSNGIGVQVVDLQKSNVLQLDLMMPMDSNNNVSGLFGDLAGNMKSSNGSYMDLVSISPMRLYNNFQLSWAVNETDSLFVTHIPANHSFMGPVIVSPTPLPDAQRSAARSLCQNDEACVFDYMHTNSRILASATHMATKRYAYLAESLQPVRSCGLLNVPRAEKTSYEYTLGTATTVTGCRTGTLSGETRYTCIETSNVTQEWSPAVTATCEIQTEKANVGMIVGIVVACVVVVVIVVVVVVIIMRRRKQSVHKRSGEPQSEKEMVTLKSKV